MHDALHANIGLILVMADVQGWNIGIASEVKIALIATPNSVCQ